MIATILILLWLTIGGLALAFAAALFTLCRDKMPRF